MYLGIEHTAIATPNPEQLAQWYDRTLGFAIVHRTRTAFFVRASDGTMLEIIPSEGPAAETKMRTPGIRHLAIRVDDFDAAKKALEEKGVALAEEISKDGNRIVFFNDPEGNILHLIYRSEPLP